MSQATKERERIAERNAAICAVAVADPSISVRELSTRFNTGENRVYNILHRAGIKGVNRPRAARLHPCAQRDAEIVAYILADPDATYVQIGEKFGMTYRHVFKILKAAGMRKPRSRRGNPAQRERNAVVTMMAQDNMPQKEIEAELGLTNVTAILKTYDPEWQERITAQKKVRAERNAKIIEMIRANPAIKTRELGEKFGMATSSVFSVIKNAGLTKPRVSYEPVNPVHAKRNEMIINFVKANPELTCDQAGEKWGMTGGGVFHILKTAGISKPRVRARDNMKRDRDEVIAEMRRDGMALKEIAAQLGMRRETVYSVIVRHYPTLQPKRIMKVEKT